MVQAKYVPELLQFAGHNAAVHMDPGHGRLLQEGFALTRRRQLLLVEIRVGMIDEVDRQRYRRCRFHQRARGRSGRVIAF